MRIGTKAVGFIAQGVERRYNLGTMDRMKIFVSWSGPRSGAVAEVLKEYLPIINNAFDPWLSSADIAKGSRSTVEIADALNSARAGIICLTPNNLTEPWILFEAGAVSKTVEKPLACTLLVDLEPSDVSKPLGDFQHTRLKEKELLQLVKTLNKAIGDAAMEEAHIVKAFNLCWPELSQRLEKVPADGVRDRHPRPVAEVLEELVLAVKVTSQQNSAMLKQLWDNIAEVSANVATLVPSVNNPYTISGSFVPGPTVPLSTLLGPQFISPQFMPIDRTAQDRRIAPGSPASPFAVVPGSMSGQPTHLSQTVRLKKHGRLRRKRASRKPGDPG